MIEIELATSIHVEAVGRLFDLYRRFYECDPDLDLATSYIRERIERGESFIHVATIDGEAIGFVQSYPSFCSVDAIKRHVLYDLYVDESHRDVGVGAQLMDAARMQRSPTGRSGSISRPHTTTPGQHLYEKLGYERVEGSLPILSSFSRAVQPTRPGRFSPRSWRGPPERRRRAQGRHTSRSGR